VREEALAKLQLINQAMAALGPGGDRAEYDQKLAGYRAEQELRHPLADIDFYQALQLRGEATADEIQQALAAAEERLKTEDIPEEAQTRQEKLIALARHTLLDAERRQAYDNALREKLARAAQRDAAKPVPLRINGHEVHTWSELEAALVRYPAQGYRLLADGEIEAWLRWSQNQRQRADWMRELAERIRTSATPAMEYEELLHLLNRERPFRLFAAGAYPESRPRLTVHQIEDLPARAEEDWDVCIQQFDSLLDWVRRRGHPDILRQYGAYPASDNPHIQLERLLVCIDPQLAAPEPLLEDVEGLAIDFGIVQAWGSPVQRFTVRQQGRGYLYGVVSSPTLWISVQPATFAGEATRIEVGIKPSNLPGGSVNSGQVILTPLDGRGDPVAIQVRFQRRTFFESVKRLFQRE